MKYVRILAWLSVLLIQVSHATTHTLTQTKQSLNQLENKIKRLEEHLNQAQDKQTIFRRELAATEKKIHESSLALNKIQQNYSAKESKIKQLQPQIDQLNTRVEHMQLALSNYLRARYKMNNKQPLIWLFSQNNAHSVDHLFTYYQYLIQSHKHLMDDLKLTQNTLALKKATLNRDLNEIDTIQQQLKMNQQQLDHDKKYHMALIQHLNQDISSKQQTLESYRRNQINLTRLLTTLVQQSVLQTRHPLTQMKKKIIKPVDTATIEKINQGLLFRAPEGTSVQAVSPGKVVFCDWLNGYGLLMIIDHGWGFMTLYANNLAVFKQKGDTVTQGERIATIGHSGTLRQNGLYFEIRHRGKAVPPLEWLK